MTAPLLTTARGDSATTLGALLEVEGLLRAPGMSALSEEGALRSAAGVVAAARSLLARGASPRTKAWACHVPGRIEVLGKHTDYAGGRSLLTATERGISAVAVDVPEPVVRVIDAGRAEGAERARGGDRAGGSDRAETLIRLVPGSPRHPQRATAEASAPDWTRYPRNVVLRVAGDFGPLAGGTSVAFRSSLPPAAGLSSSSALTVAVFLALAARWSLGERHDRPWVRAMEDARRHGASDGAAAERIALAEYLAAVEAGRPFGDSGGESGGESGRGSGRGSGDASAGSAGGGGVGTRGGGEDHTAILGAVEGALARYRFLPTVAEEVVPLPAGLRFVVGVSGVRAEKAGVVLERYNRLSDEAARMAELWRESTREADPHLGAILARHDGARRRLERLVAQRAEGARLAARLRQFHAESEEIIPAATRALAAGDAAGFGSLAARSQSLAEEVLENQVPETVHLVQAAKAEGALAASAFGAGFGGAVWALVAEREAASFLQRWREAYLARFPHRSPRSTFFATRAGPPAWCISPRAGSGDPR